MATGKKKLLVLDINGLLVDTYRKGERLPDRPQDGRVNTFFVYVRPFCDDFLGFCFENFLVGVWSSVKKHNVHSMVEFVFKETKQKLAFVWLLCCSHLSRQAPVCDGRTRDRDIAQTGFRHPDNRFMPVFLKELWNLWRKSLPDLPWEAGEYGPTNTLLIDDSSYKAIKNPPYTAIFPKTFKATDRQDDHLGTKLRTYLEGLRQVRDVQVYLHQNPLGEPSNPIGDQRWSRIFLALQPKTEVAAHSELTEQPTMKNVPQFQSAARSGHHQKILDTEKNEEESKEILREEDADNLHIMLQKIRLEEVPPRDK